MGVLQTESFHHLDDVTKRGATQVLEALRGNENIFNTAIEIQTEKCRVLQTQTRLQLAQDIETAAANLQGQNERTHSITTNEQQRTRTEVLTAIADMSSEYDHALCAQGEGLSAHIEKQNEYTRTQIVGKLDTNQEIMKQEIHGLQRGLYQLQIEIDRKVEELKELVVKINATREGPERHSLKERGNSATIIIMSLGELYKSLQVLDNSY